MAPVRTYQAVLHGQDVSITVYPSTQPKHVAWVMPTSYGVHHTPGYFAIDQTGLEDPYVYEQHKRAPVNMDDYELEDLINYVYAGPTRG